MSGPTVTVTQINGGRTRNSIPDRCTVAVDMRVIPGMDPVEERCRLIRVLGELGLEISHSDVQLVTPPLSTSPDHPFCAQVLQACQRQAGPDVTLRGVPYGTDAAWVSAKAPTVVLGPGNIDVAHSVDEYVDLNQVVACARIYRELMSVE